MRLNVPPVSSPAKSVVQDGLRTPGNSSRRRFFWITVRPVEREEFESSEARFLSVEATDFACVSVFLQAAVLCQCTEPVDYTTAFKAVQQAALTWYRAHGHPRRRKQHEIGTKAHSNTTTTRSTTTTTIIITIVIISSSSIMHDHHHDHHHKRHHHHHQKRHHNVAVATTLIDWRRLGHTTPNPM